MTAADFLRAIVTDPDSVEPRLVYADWLEERGDPRGEFIRVQVELAKLVEQSGHPRPTPLARSCKCNVCEIAKPLCRREWELLEAHYKEWMPPYGSGGVSVCLKIYRDVAGHEPGPGFGDAIIYEFRRGFVESVSLSLDAFMGDCGRCGGDKFVWEEYLGGVAGRQKRRREVHCPACAGTGKLAVALALSCPLREVRLTDREPYPRERPDGRLAWFHPDVPIRRTYSRVPEPLFFLLTGYDNKGATPDRVRWYNSRSAALAALSAAAARHASTLAGLP